MAVNGLDVAGKLISLLIALMHKRPIANLMACSLWVIEAGLIGRIDWRPSDKKGCVWRWHLLTRGVDLLRMAESPLDIDRLWNCRRLMLLNAVTYSACVNDQMTNCTIVVVSQIIYDHAAAKTSSSEHGSHFWLLVLSHPVWLAYASTLPPGGQAVVLLAVWLILWLAGGWLDTCLWIGLREISVQSVSARYKKVQPWEEDKQIWALSDEVLFENFWEYASQERFVYLSTHSNTHAPPSFFFLFLAPHHRQNCNATLNMKMLISDGTSLPRCWHVSCPTLFLSRLISSNLPHSSPLPVFPPLHRSQMPLLCSALLSSLAPSEWRFHASSITSGLLYTISDLRAHTHTHTHTHTRTNIETSTQHLWCGFPSQKKAWLPEPIQPRSWWNTIMSHTPRSLFFFFFIFLLLFLMEDFSLFVADLKQHFL